MPIPAAHQSIGYPPACHATWHQPYIRHPRSGRYRSSLADETRYYPAVVDMLDSTRYRPAWLSSRDYPWSGTRCHTIGEPDGLIISHEYRLLLSASDADRRATCTGLFGNEFDRHLIWHIRYSIDKGLPAGNDRIVWESYTLTPVRPGRAPGSHRQ